MINSPGVSVVFLTMDILIIRAILYTHTRGVMKGAIVFCGIGIHIVQSSELTEEGSLYLTDKSMAISRLNNVAFIHVPKTAGSFVSQSCLFDDARMRHKIGGHYPYREVFRHKYSRNMTSVTSFHNCARTVRAFCFGICLFDVRSWK